MPRAVHLSPYIKLTELLEKLGQPPDRVHCKRLLRTLRAREQCTGAKILFRGGTSPNSPVLVTLPALREACPEMFSRRDEAAEMMREAMRDVQQKLLDLKAGQKALAAKQRQLAFAFDGQKSASL